MQSDEKVPEPNNSSTAALGTKENPHLLLRLPQGINLSNTPGGSLAEADLRPETLITNVRAQLFPATNSKIRNSIQVGLTRSAWNTIYAVESNHNKQCKNITLAQVQSLYAPKTKQAPTIYQTDITNNSDIADLPNSAQLSLAHSTEQLELAQKQVQQRIAESKANNVNAVVPNRGFIPQFYSMLTSQQPSNSRIIGCEQWTINRCNTLESYEVVFYACPDSFFASVSPNNISGLWHCTKYGIKKWLFPWKTTSS